MKSRILALAGIALVAALALGAYVRNNAASKENAETQAASTGVGNMKAGSSSTSSVRGTVQQPSSVNSGAKSSGPALPVQVSMIELAPSEIFTITPGELARQVPITGSLRASNQTLVKSKVAGELTELLVREGTTVQAGALVARIETTDFELRLREREAQLRGAEAQLDQAKRTLDNNKQLLEKNFISQSAFDSAKSGVDVAMATLDTQKAQLAQARKALNDTRVIAPMGGMVAERFAQPGEKISTDSKIISIVDLSKMELEAAIPSSDVGSVRVGQTLTLDVEGIDKPMQGRVARISPSTQAGTRSVPIYIALENKDARARAGLFAQGTLALDKRSNVLTIPINSVRDLAGRTYAYAIEGDKIVERDLKLGARDETKRAENGSEGIVEVLSGLKTGDQIVGVNLGTLRAGINVKPNAPKGPSSDLKAPMKQP